MKFALRDYQSAMLQETHAALKVHRNVLLQSPTGSGKTALSAHMLSGVARRGLSAFFNCHRAELVEQTADTFSDLGIPFGIVAAGFPGSPMAPIQICSVDSLKNRLDRVKPPALVVWDEAHHAAAAGWRKIMEHFGRSRHVGLTATPQRLDGRGLDDLFTSLVQGPSVAWLIEQGWLAPYRAFAPSAPDVSGIHSRGGDFKREEAAGAMDKAAITGDAVQHYLRLARGKQGVAFCCSVEHSEHVAAQFREAGVTARHLDGNTDRNERRRVVKAFRQGEIDVLTNVDLFGEGFDLPAMAVSMLLRPTKSLGLYLQQVGRALRPAPGKEHALILDHAGNIARHGLPDEEREWSLAGRKKKAASEASTLVRRCPSCYLTHAPRPRCPACGHVYEVESRVVEQVEGDLAEIDVKEIRRAREEENRRARTHEDLTKLGVARGYRNPAKWAQHMLDARERNGAPPAGGAQRRAEAQFEFYMEGRS